MALQAFPRSRSTDLSAGAPRIRATPGRVHLEVTAASDRGRYPPHRQTAPRKATAWGKIPRPRPCQVAVSFAETSRRPTDPPRSLRLGEEPWVAPERMR